MAFAATRANSSRGAPTLVHTMEFLEQAVYRLYPDTARHRTGRRSAKLGHAIRVTALLGPDRRWRNSLQAIRIIRRRVNDGRGCWIFPVAAACQVRRPRRRSAASLRKCSASALVATAATRHSRDAVAPPSRLPGTRPSAPRPTIPQSGREFSSLIRIFMHGSARYDRVQRKSVMGRNDCLSRSRASIRVDHFCASEFRRQRHVMQRGSSNCFKLLPVMSLKSRDDPAGRSIRRQRQSGDGGWQGDAGT